MHLEGIHARIIQTLGGCPSQWDGLTESGECLYIRFRGGRLRYGLGKTAVEAVDDCLGDGSRTIWTDKNPWNGYMETEEMIEKTGLIVTGGLEEPLPFDLYGDSYGSRT